MSGVVVARYRPPVSTVIPPVAVLVVLGLVLRAPGSWLFVAVFAVVFALVRSRQQLVCTDDHVAVTVVRTRRIPWSEIRGFGPGSLLRGGLRIDTVSGMVWSVAPCSWWGGPARPTDVARLEALRAER